MIGTTSSGTLIVLLGTYVLYILAEDSCCCSEAWRLAPRQLAPPWATLGCDVGVFDLQLQVSADPYGAIVPTVTQQGDSNSAVTDVSSRLRCTPVADGLRRDLIELSGSGLSAPR